MKLLPSNEMTFGKNYGLKLGVIYHYEPGYIEWLIKNVDDFSISIEHFEKLPKPTPIDNYKVKLTPDEQQKNLKVLKIFLDQNEKSQLDQIFLTVKAVGEKAYPTTVADAIEMEGLGFIIKEYEYQFPQEVKTLNNNKTRLYGNNTG
jgi:hypothetical protein